MKKLPAIIPIFLNIIFSAYSQPDSDLNYPCFYIDVGLKTYYLYKDYLCVFTPTIETGVSFQIIEDIIIKSNAQFNFGYKYIIEGKPYKFFLEELNISLGANYSGFDTIDIDLFVNTKLNFRCFNTDSSLIPGMVFAMTLGDVFSPGIGFKTEIFPGNNFKNLIIPFYTLQFDTSNILPLNLTISYEGNFGIRLNDYNYRIPVYTENGVAQRIQSSDNPTPFFNFYGHKLTLDLLITEYLTLKYNVGNRFYYYKRKDGLEFSQYETLRSIIFMLDIILSF